MSSDWKAELEELRFEGRDRVLERISEENASASRLRGIWNYEIRIPVAVALAACVAIIICTVGLLHSERDGETSDYHIHVLQIGGGYAVY